MSGVFTFFIVLVSSCLCLSTALDSSCGRNVVKTIVVAKTGLGFRTVQSAINSVPERNSQWIKIKISRGVYVEKVMIPYTKPCIILEGEGRALTTISYNAHAVTDESSTFIADPPYTVVRHITFKNTYNRPILGLRTDLSSNIKPAVAATVQGDKSAFFDCGFVGLQDTLWDKVGRHYFKNCYIEGAVDFIFGYGQSVYEDCVINATAGALSSRVQYGYITAQGRGSREDQSGFVFLRGSVTGTTKVFLGRAYGLYSRVIFIETNLGAVVVPQGWDSWRYPGLEAMFTYVEVGCQGPGSDTSHRVPWIEKLSGYATKILFSVNSFIDQDQWLRNIPN